MKEFIREVSGTQRVYFDVLEREELIKAVSAKFAIDYTDPRWMEKKIATLADKAGNVIITREMQRNALNNYLAFITITNPSFTVKQATEASRVIQASESIGTVRNVEKLRTVDELWSFVVSNM
jgi:hypothetical protein